MGQASGETTNIQPAAFADTRWLYAVGQPVDAGVDSLGRIDAIRSACEADPDTFFAPPYSDPYEGWCVVDHHAAEELPHRLRSSVEAVAKRAYLAAWEVLPHPEFCGLVSDHVHTIYSLLVMSRPLSTFTNQRASWLIAGRVPWGYTGDFLSGRWLVL